MRIYTNYTADIIRTTQITKDGSLLIDEQKIFSNIPIALWRSSRSYNDTTLATNTNQNSYEINLEANYNNIKTWDIVFVHELQFSFKVEQVVMHHNHRWLLDNIEVFISQIV